jgi:hypothetical protein
VVLAGVALGTLVRLAGPTARHPFDGTVFHHHGAWHLWFATTSGLT